MFTKKHTDSSDVNSSQLHGNTYVSVSCTIFRTKNNVSFFVRSMIICSSHRTTGSEHLDHFQ